MDLLGKFSMQQTKTWMGLTFSHVISPTLVDGSDSVGDIVRYDDHHGRLTLLQRGVYIVTVDDDVTYVGKFKGDFARRWLYTNLGKLYHHKRHRIADALRNGKIVHVYAATEDDLRNSIAATRHDPDKWINIHGIECVLINNLKPQWNDQNC
jgi:hypothetical protein